MHVRILRHLECSICDGPVIWRRVSQLSRSVPLHWLATFQTPIYHCSSNSLSGWQPKLRPPPRARDAPRAPWGPLLICAFFRSAVD